MSPRFPALSTLFAVLFAAPVGAEVHPGAVAARAVLKKHCYRCHGESGAAEGGMNFILDRGKLLAKGMVLPKEPDKSPLLKRMSAGDMPADDITRPTAEEMAALRAWIADGAAAFDEAAAPRKTVSRDEVTALIAADLDRPANVGRRRFLRYFTLTHLANANRSAEDLQTHRNGLSKLVNSLSWGRRLVRPEPIDPGKTVFRVDLRDLQWSFPVWNAVAAAHPYNLDVTGDGEKKVAAQTQTRVWAVRGDWFVAAASRPPLYHQVLQIPPTVLALEARLGVDVARNLANGTTARAGFNGSGVSHNNRLIERHESYFGGYWKSYDFAGNAGRQNLFDHPLGPGDEASHFTHDGGEFIFNLPNGLQGYMLADGKGNRIDKGPTAIVSDPARPDRAVENGISCMGCHAQGMIRKDDQIRPHVLKNRQAYPAGERAGILTLYPDKAAFAKLIDEDQERFRRAVDGLGIPLTKTEPIITTAKRYEDELDLPQALAEADADEPTFRRVLAATPDLARGLGGVLVSGGTLKRDLFVQSFPTLQAALGREHYSPGIGVAPTAKRVCGIDDAGLLFSSPVLREVQLATDELKTRRNLDIAILTLGSVPDAEFAAYQQADGKGRLAVVSRLADARVKALKPNGLALVIVREGGSHTWSVVRSNVKTVTDDDRAKLMAAVKPHFDKGDFDAGLRAFLATAKEVLAREPSPVPAEPKK